MNTCQFLRCLVAAALLGAFVTALRADEGFLLRMKEFYRNRPYPVDHFAPGNYGYNLDDQSRGYFGGGRYTEYYNYGRGGNLSNLANFPGPAPGPAWLYDHRNWIGNEPVRPFAGMMLRLPPSTPTVARLTIQVPADAVVWLEQQQMGQIGGVRQFITPPLEPGAAYTYTIRARWFDGQQHLEQMQRVNIEAGQSLAVNFPVPVAVPVPAVPVVPPTLTPTQPPTLMPVVSTKPAVPPTTPPPLPPYVLHIILGE